jgi:hypothetical protein
MTPSLKFDVFCSFQSCLIFTAIKLFLFASFGYNFPEPSHMFFRHDFISSSTEHEYRRCCRDEWDFRRRIPFLVTQKGKGAENWKCVWYQTGKRSERIFEDQGLYLSIHVNFQNPKIQITISSTTLVEFRLARSTATAPPIDCPYRTFMNSCA